MLNQRYNKLVSSFLNNKKLHYIHLTSRITCHEIIFIIDYILPYLSTNHRVRLL
jgi:hypothetical protein